MFCRNIQITFLSAGGDHICNAQNADDQIMFVVEVEHAGIFMMKNIPAEHVQRVLAIDCPLMLFPFTRQIISQASVDGGFMPFLMEPINFIALYENAQQQQATGPKQ